MLAASVAVAAGVVVGPSRRVGVNSAGPPDDATRGWTATELQAAGVQTSADDMKVLPGSMRIQQPPRRSTPVVRRGSAARDSRDAKHEAKVVGTGDQRGRLCPTALSSAPSGGMRESLGRGRHRTGVGEVRAAVTRGGQAAKGLHERWFRSSSKDPGTWKAEGPVRRRRVPKRAPTRTARRSANVEGPTASAKVTSAKSTVAAVTPFAVPPGVAVLHQLMLAGRKVKPGGPMSLHLGERLGATSSSRGVGPRLRDHAQTGDRTGKTPALAPGKESN